MAGEPGLANSKLTVDAVDIHGMDAVLVVTQRSASVDADDEAFDMFRRCNRGRMASSGRVHVHHPASRMKGKGFPRASDEAKCPGEADHQSVVGRCVLGADPTRRNSKEHIFRGGFRLRGEKRGSRGSMVLKRERHIIGVEAAIAPFIGIQTRHCHH
jgi:hypothetical protein